MVYTHHVVVGDDCAGGNRGWMLTLGVIMSPCLLGCPWFDLNPPLDFSSPPLWLSFFLVGFPPGNCVYVTSGESVLHTGFIKLQS
jgi:hypothetical protein